MARHSFPRRAALAAVAVAALAGCGGGSPAINTLPSGVTHHSMTVYPASTPGPGATAQTQDLLTAGLGKTGLGGAAPVPADPLNPTAAELRRMALHANYRRRQCARRARHAGSR